VRRLDATSRKGGSILDTLNIGKPFNRFELWGLFVATAFPIHLWAILVILMDVSWVAERTHYWDAVGTAGYGTMFALVESVLIFVVLVLIGIVLKKYFDGRKRVTLLGSLIIMITIWSVVGQVFSMWELSLPPEIALSLVDQESPLRFLYAGLLLVVITTVLVAAYSAVYSRKFQTFFIKTLNWITPLMGLYLFLDVVGIAIVILRNTR
jgi:hypothetical protein